LYDIATHIRILFHEPRLKVFEQAEQIVRHQDLSVAGSARADADGRDFECRGNLLCEIGWNALDHHRKRTRLFGGEGILHDLVRIPLHAKATEAAYRLGGHTDMAHYRDVRTGNCHDARRAPYTSFDFNGVRASFLDQLAGVLQGLLRADLVGHE